MRVERRLFLGPALYRGRLSMSRNTSLLDLEEPPSREERIGCDFSFPTQLYLLPTPGVVELATFQAVQLRILFHPYFHSCLRLMSLLFRPTVREVVEGVFSL